MNQPADLEAARAALLNPETTPAELSAITANHPSLWVEVAQHSNVYPDLLAHLAQYGDASVQEAVRQRESGGPTDESLATTLVAPSAPNEAHAPDSPSETLVAPASPPTTPITPAPAATVLAEVYRDAVTPAEQPPAIPLSPVPPTAPHNQTTPSGVPTPPSMPTAPGMPTPPPMPPSTPIPAEYLAGTALPKKSKKGILIAGIIAAIVLLAGGGAAVFFLVLQPANADSKYASALSEYAAAQDDLILAVQDATTSLEITDPNQLTNPNLHEELKAAIEEAEPFLEEPPRKASSAREVGVQTSKMKDDTAQMIEQTAALIDTTARVDASRIEFFKAWLSASINEAQDVYNQSNGAVRNEQLRVDLNQAINDTRRVIDGIDDLDRTTMADTVRTQLAALTLRVNAVQAGQSTRCPGGVLLPEGIPDMVCGGMPIGATAPRVYLYGETLRQFEMPSGNIGCTTTQSGDFQCEIDSKTWTVPYEVKGATPPYGSGDAVPGIENGRVTGYWHGGVPPWADSRFQGEFIPTLNYGQTANMGQVACLSTEDGVICWDIDTHHGFLMNRTRFVHW